MFLLKTNRKLSKSKFTVIANLCVTFTAAV